MKKFLILLFMLFTLSGFAQSGEVVLPLPDSLALKLENSKDNDLNRAEVLIQIIKFYNINRHYIESRPYVEELVKISDRLDDAYIKARAELSLGTLISETENDVNQAFKHVHSAYILVSQLPETPKNMEMLVGIYNSLGIHYAQIGLDAESYECYLKGLELNKKVKNKDIDNILRINLLNVYNSLGKYDESIALGNELLNNEDFVYDKYVPYFIIANNYRDKESYDTALMYMDSAFVCATQTHDISRCYANKGLIYFCMKDYKNASNCLKTSLYNYSDVNSSETMASDLIYLGSTYGALSKQDSALLLINQGIAKARQANLSVWERDGLFRKFELLYNADTTIEIYWDFFRYSFIVDSMEKSNNGRRLEALWFQQEFKKVEAQLEYERQLSDMKHRKQKMTLLFVALVLLLSILVMVLLLNRKKIMLKNKDIQLENEQLIKDSMAKELDLRNREMTAKTLVQVQRQEWVNEMIQKLKAASDDKKALSANVREIIRNLEQYKNVSNPDDFDYYFTKTNPDFYDKLRADFPNLTSNELRLCAYLKMNLNTKDIAAICNITPESARVARSRLRKSLNLVDSNIDLTSFLSNY